MKTRDPFSAKNCKTRALMRSSRLIPGGSPVRKSKSLKIRSEDFANMSIEQLKQERIKAIKAMDFERSQQILSEITRTDKEADKTAIANAKQRLISDIDAAIERHHQRKQNFAATNQQSERSIRASIQKQFAAMRERHIEAITEIEIEKTLELAKELGRELAGANSMRKAAHVLAMNNKFEEAREVRQELESKRETERTKRANAITKTYAETLRKLTAKQTQELTNLEDALIDQLIAREYELDCQHDQLEKDFAGDIEQLLERETTETLKQLKMAMKRTNVSAQLAKTVASKLNDAVQKKSIPLSLAKSVSF